MEKATVNRGVDGTFLFGKDGAMLRKIVHNAAIGMAVAGMDGHVVYTNLAFARDFGCAEAGDAALSLADIFEPEDTAVSEALREAMAGRRDHYDGEHRCRNHSGVLHWAYVAISVLRSDATGEPLYLVVQHSSIDRRKKAEQALAESESRWHFALESARQGVWDHDNRTRRMFYSPMWRTMRGIPQDEEVDDSQEAWLARVHPDDRERVRPGADRQNRGEDGYDILEYRERHRDGHYIWILSRGKPVEWDEDGNVIRTVGTDTDITHLKEIEARLEHAATHDSLTGIANRAAFQQALATTVAQGGENCLLFIDLDHFKPVNDMLGHAAGDAMLADVAKAMERSLRRADLCARMGGDEFAVLLRGCPVEDAQAVAAKIVAAISAVRVEVKGTPHALGASVGLVQLKRGLTPDAALASADTACYAAKKSGRGGVVCAN